MDPDEALLKYEAARASGDKQGAYDAAEALYGWIDRGGFRPAGYTQRKHAEVVAFYRKNRALGRASGTGGRASDKHEKMVATYTTAPEAYDYTGFGAVDLGVVGHTDRGKPIRKVMNPEAGVDYQRGRYASGMNMAADEAEWKKLVSYKLVTKVGAASGMAAGRASGFKRTHALHIPGAAGYTLCGERATAKDLGSPAETTCYYCAHFWAKQHGGGTLVGGKGQARGSVHPSSCRCSACSLFVRSKGKAAGKKRSKTVVAVAIAVASSGGRKPKRPKGRSNGAMTGHAIHLPGKGTRTLCGRPVGSHETGTLANVSCDTCARAWVKASPHGKGGFIGTGRGPLGGKGRSGGATGAMTPEQVAHALREHLAPVLGDRVWRVNGPTALSPSVHVIFANVPRGASELDALNADKSAMISISSAEWDRGSREARAAQGPVAITASAPARYETPPASLVTTTQFAGRGMRMRKKSGTPAQVIAHVVKFFKEHA